MFSIRLLLFFPREIEIERINKVKVGRKKSKNEKTSLFVEKEKNENKSLSLVS